jgi:hypothetical protein
MSDTILLVFEGGKTEPDIFDNIKDVFTDKIDSNIIYVIIFGTEIYKLWKEVKDDPYVDTFVILKEVCLKNDKSRNDKLRYLSKDDISEIHLFFDFEGHSHPEMGMDNYIHLIREMLDIFKDENDQGRLWISYPMVEALKHTYKDSTKCFDCIQNIGDNTKYKEKVGKIADFQDTRKYIRSDWYHIIAINILKAICLVNCNYSMPAYTDILSVLNQSCIFAVQKERFILLNSSVVVLSAFPFFLLYYIGEELYNEIHLEEFDKECKFKHIAGNETAAKMVFA